MRSKFIIFVLLLLVCLPVRADEADKAAEEEISTQEASDRAAADKIAELRKKIEELTKEAEMYRGNVLQKQQEANSLKQQIAILNSQIKKIEAEIGITENRITSASIEIVDLEGKLYDTQRDIDFKKAAIGETISELGQRQRTSLVATLFKHQTLSTFASEAQQAVTLHERLNHLLANLKDQKIKLEENKVQVETKKTELQSLSKKQASQKSSLAGTKSYQNKLLVDTKGKESEYQKLLNETEKQKAAFFEELQSLEKTAIADGKAIVNITASAVPARGTKIFEQPYHDAAYITQGYGMTSYAKRGAYGGAIHNGRDQASGCGSPIYAIGAGVVIASGFNAGFGNFVAVKHDAGGGMVSVYAHMVRGTHVANGTRVDTDTELGNEGTTGTSTGCHLHLSIYKKFFTYINPKNNQLYFNYADGSLNPADYIKS